MGDGPDRLAAAARDHDAPRHVGGTSVGALIMLGTLLGLIILIFALVLRYDPEARGRSKSEGPGDA